MSRTPIPWLGTASFLGHEGAHASPSYRCHSFLTDEPAAFWEERQQQWSTLYSRGSVSRGSHEAQVSCTREQLCHRRMSILEN